MSRWECFQVLCGDVNNRHAIYLFKWVKRKEAFKSAFKKQIMELK